MKMHGKRMLMLTIAIAALVAGIADGKECKGVNFPDQAAVEGSNLMLNGLGDDFAKAFLSIWLGTDPPNPEIKAGLLGGACG